MLFGSVAGGRESTRTRLLDELLRIHEYERRRLGQELHDSAGQLVIALQLSIAHLRILEENSGHDDLIEEIQETVRQIDQEIRSLAFLQYPAELGDRCLCSAVQSLSLGFGRRTGIRTTFKCVGDPAPVDEATSVALLRVAQEALVNVHRHSHASGTKVVLERRADELVLTVSDDGVGMPATESGQKPRGIGLQGMQHRIEMLGGRFRIRNLKRGTRMFASVPVGVETPNASGIASCDPHWLAMLG